ncbi:MAG: ribosome maturation factor RimP [Actinomycetota bacterium]
MHRGEVLGSMRATCESILARHGVELVAVTLGAEGRRQALRLTVDRPEGAPGVDEMAALSEEISRALDAEDPIPGRYHLELESPGIERPLVRPSDYRRFVGSMAKVRYKLPEEGRRTLTGTIAEAGEESFLLEAEGEGDSGGGTAAGERRTAHAGRCEPPRSRTVTIPYETVERARLVVDWDRELKGPGRQELRGRRA